MLHARDNQASYRAGYVHGYYGEDARTATAPYIIGHRDGRKARDLGNVNLDILLGDKPQSFTLASPAPAQLNAALRYIALANNLA